MNVYNGTQNCKLNEEIKKNVRENCKPRNDKVRIYLTREKYIANPCMCAVTPKISGLERCKYICAKYMTVSIKLMYPFKLDPFKYHYIYIHIAGQYLNTFTVFIHCI